VLGAVKIRRSGPSLTRLTKPFCTRQALNLAVPSSATSLNWSPSRKPCQNQKWTASGLPERFRTRNLLVRHLALKPFRDHFNQLGINTIAVKPYQIASFVLLTADADILGKLHPLTVLGRH
jgi:hypothetical protein